MRQHTSRREALKRLAGAVAVPVFVPAAALGRAGRPAVSNRLTIGCIGLGSMGMRHIKGFLQEHDCQIIAVCDVDRRRRQAAVKEVNTAYKTRDCAATVDFHECIDREDVDALVLSLPDHWHAIPAIAGARAGKDIYGEKPLATTVNEGKEIVAAVNRYGIVWQTGSWQRSTAHFRFGCELVRNRRIGKLERVEVGIGPGPRIDPQPVMPIPPELDYERWLGPAPWAPYTEKRCHWNFRWILDYSGGQVTDWGAHHIDIAHWGMGADDTGPVEIAGTGVFPASLWNAAVTYRFTCRYANGVELEVASNNFLKQGVRFTGDQGWVHLTRGGLAAEPKSLLKEEIGPNEIHLPRPPGDHRQGHRRDFLKCIASRGKPITPVEVGHRSITVAHLGNIAMLLGRTIRWDPAREEIVGDPGAARMLGRSYRSPWQI